MSFLAHLAAVFMLFTAAMPIVRCKPTSALPFLALALLSSCAVTDLGQPAPEQSQQMTSAVNSGLIGSGVLIQQPPAELRLPPLDPSKPNALSANYGTVQVGQTLQLVISVTINGQSTTPIWSTESPDIVHMTPSGQVTGLKAGTARVIATHKHQGHSASFEFSIDVLPAPSSTPTAPNNAAAQKVFMLTNQARSTGRYCGSTYQPAMPALTYNAKLEQVAYAHAVDMATNNYFAHKSLDGRTLTQRLTNAGYDWRAAGENIAAGYPTPEDAVAGWLKSEGHCKNIMHPMLKELGVGYTQVGSSQYKHYWVQDFGVPR